MANDRLYMVCQCRERSMLYKYYPQPDKMGYLGEAVEEFINDHMLSCFNFKKNDPPVISLIWENTAAEITK